MHRHVSGLEAWPWLRQPFPGFGHSRQGTLAGIVCRFLFKICSILLISALKVARIMLLRPDEKASSQRSRRRPLVTVTAHLITLPATRASQRYPQGERRAFGMRARPAKPMRSRPALAQAATRYPPTSTLLGRLVPRR